MKRWLAFAPLAALAALGILFATFGLHHDPHYAPDALVGQAAPDARLPGLDGSAPQDLKGRLAPGTLVNFFASWCAPCIQEQPALMALKAQGVRIVGVSYKDAPEKTRAMLARLGDPFAAVLVDRDGRTGLDYGVSGVPETFLIGQGGRILAKHTGPLTPESAEALLERAPAG